MPTRIGVLVGVLLCGCAAHNDGAPATVRQRFVPATSTSARGNGAIRSALHAFGDKPGMLMMQAWAGIGDKFPVQHEDGRTFFEVTLVEGNDDHLVLELSSAGGSQRMDVWRDKAASARVSGSMYEFVYPSVTANATAKPTTDKAFIIVTCQSWSSPL
jgi:hypothetical protein